MSFEGDIRYQILEELRAFRNDYLPGSGGDGGGNNGGTVTPQLTAYSIGTVSVGATWVSIGNTSSSGVIIFNDSDFTVRIRPTSDSSGAYLTIGPESALSLPILLNISEWRVIRDDGISENITLRYLSTRYGGS